MCQKHCRNTSDYWEDGISAFLYRLAGCQGMLFPVVGGRWLGRIGSVIEIMHFYCSSKVAGGVHLPLPFLRTRYIYIYMNAERKRKRERWKSTYGCNKAREIARNMAFTRERYTRSNYARSTLLLDGSRFVEHRARFLSSYPWRSSPASSLEEESRGRNAVFRQRITSLDF